MASHLHTRSPVAKFVQNRCNYLAAEELLMSNHKEKKKKNLQNGATAQADYGLDFKLHDFGT